MTTGHDRRPGFKSRPHPDDIADSIDMHRQTELAHPADHQITGLLVFVAQRKPTHPITGDPADLGQLVKTPA
jgi:hypothetical protein